MQAILHVANDTDAQREALRAIIEGMVLVNLAWLQAQEAAGLHPPCCTHCAEPPWCAKPVRYVAHHGAPLGTSRHYYDGPTMMFRGVGTCADIVAYDVAAARHKGDATAAVVVEGAGPHYHAVAIIKGQRVDPSAVIARRQLANTITPCPCGGEHEG